MANQASATAIKNRQEIETANKGLLSFVNGSTSMPQGGQADTLSTRKMLELGVGVEGFTGLVNEMQASQFDELVTNFEQHNEKPFNVEVVAISKTSVKFYDKDGKEDGMQDAIKAETVVSVPVGATSDVKTVTLNIIYRTKASAATFLQSFKAGDKGSLQLNAQKIDSKPNAWARVI